MQQEIIPMMAYENGVSALEWLQLAFGFGENKEMRMQDKDGRLTHAELITGNATIMIATPSLAYESINKHRSHCKQTNEWLSVPWVVDGLLVYVDDIEKHFMNAKKNGAEILSDIEVDFPGKRYRCADIEGHRWMFMEKKKN